MFRQVFIPTENNNRIPLVNIPREWYGQEIEILVFPVKQSEKATEEIINEKASDFQKFIFSAPVMSDEQYCNFNQKRMYFNRWRTQ